MIRTCSQLLAVTLAVGLLFSCNPRVRDNQFSEAQEKKEVWKAVEKRFYSWKDNDFESHMSVYHPDWRRWSLNSRKLMTKEDFPDLWNNMKSNEQVINMELEPVDIRFYNDGQMAIAHFISTESYLWTGPEETNAMGESIARGSVQTATMRWSDVMVKEGGQWLYVGGHRDGGSIENED